MSRAPRTPGAHDVERFPADPGRPEPPLRPGRAGGPRPAGLLASLRGSLRASLGVLVLYTFLFHLSVVRGSSMAPGIHDGDRILVEPWSYVFDDVERGDVVVLRYPLDPSVDYIKRVVGLPGDRVTMGGGRLWVNGELRPEPYVASADQDCYLSVIVEPEHYYVLGDNRRRSSDSRDFGQVPARYLRGRVDLRLWPPARVGLVR